MEKFDIHSHVLPKVDDGSFSVRQSLEMLQIASGQGIHTLIATPHYSAHFNKTEIKDIRRLCRALEKAARERIHPDFRIYPGQEIFCSADSLEKLKKKELLSLADSRYVLLEFMPQTPYSDLFRSVREVMMSQYTPVLAHIERYRALREEGRVEELIQTGALMQMNYRPIGGRWHDETTRWCRKMLKEGNIHLLGTDMHNTDTRSPQTESAERWMEKHLNEEYMEAICYGNANKILENRTI